MKSKLALPLTLLAALILSTTLHAGGLWLYEVATPRIGLAGAGWAAGARYASTAFTNPAGMTRFQKSQFVLGIVPLNVKLKFTPDSGTTTSGGGGSDAGGIAPAGALFFVHNTSERFKLGISVGSYAGLGVDFDDDWAGRYYIQKGLLLTFGVTPVAAYQVSDKFSIGGGPIFMLGQLDNEVAVNNIDPGLPDGQLKTQDTGFGLGGTAGVLFEASDRTRFGLNYISPVKIDLEDVADIEGLGPGLEAILTARGLVGTKLDLSLEIPQQLMFSAYHEFSDRLAVMGNVGWQNWEAFGRVDVTITSEQVTELTTESNYKDTWHGALGLEYGISERLRLKAGFAYDSEAVADEDRTIAFAIDRQIRYATGLDYDVSNRVTLGAAYTYFDGGDASLTQSRGPLAGTVSGDFATNEIHIISTSIAWQL